MRFHLYSYVQASYFQSLSVFMHQGPIPSRTSSISICRELLLLEFNDALFRLLLFTNTSVSMQKVQIKAITHIPFCCNCLLHSKILRPSQYLLAEFSSRHIIIPILSGDAQKSSTKLSMPMMSMSSVTYGYSCI